MNRNKLIAKLPWKPNSRNKKLDKKRYDTKK